MRGLVDQVFAAAVDVLKRPLAALERSTRRLLEKETLGEAGLRVLLSLK